MIYSSVTTDIVNKGTKSQSSSISPNHIASKATDGNTGSCTHTRQDQNPFWMIKFNKEMEIFEISITNRNDHYKNRLNDFTIFIGKTLNDMNICVANKDMSTLLTADYVCDDGPMIGKYFKIVLNKRQFLTLCEVKVIGAFVSIF